LDFLGFLNAVFILQRNMEKHLKSAIHLKHTRGLGRGSDVAKKINCGVKGCKKKSTVASKVAITLLLIALTCGAIDNIA
jgi:hypothetical protein